MEYLGLWSPGLRNIFLKMCKTLRPPPPTWLMDGPLKENERKIFKNCQLSSYAIIFGHRTFFLIIKLIFRGKSEFYLFCYNAILKDCVLFYWTQLSIKIDVTVVKKTFFILNFVEKYVRLKWRKEIKCYFNYHYWICLNMPECP